MPLRLTIWQVCHPEFECKHKTPNRNPFSSRNVKRFLRVWPLAESDSSYSVSCGIPILRGKSPARLNSSSSQSCIGSFSTVLSVSHSCTDSLTIAAAAAWCCRVLLPTVLCLSVETLAPPVKQTASFKIKNAKCHLHPKLTGRTEDRGRTLGPGQSLSTCAAVYACCYFIET